MALSGADLEKIKELMEPIGTDMGALKTQITTLSNRGNIKSIQRGVFAGGRYSIIVTMSINISPINASKSILLTDKKGSAGNAAMGLLGMATLKDTSIEITSGPYADGQAITDTSWQVIEFY